MQHRTSKKPSPMSISRVPSRPTDKLKQPPKQSHDQAPQAPPKDPHHHDHTPDLTLLNKKCNIFITQKNVSEVELAHNQLNAYIDVLDDKVSKLIQRNQAQFLIAYRNHIKKVRQQMQQIRRKALCNANSTVSQTQKIETLQKQLIIFREQSLHLFEKVNDKQRIISTLQNQLSQLISEKNYLENKVKALSKRNKQLERSKYQQFSMNKFQQHSNNDSKQFQIIRPQNQLITCQMLTRQKTPSSNTNHLLSKRQRPNTTDTNSKPLSHQSVHYNSIKTNDFPGPLQLINHKIDQITSEQLSAKNIQILKQAIEDIFKSTQSITLSKSNQLDLRRSIHSSKSTYTKHLKYISTSTYKSAHQPRQPNSTTNRLQMEQFFMKSIETVRKQIVRRKGVKTLTFYNHYARCSYEEFKKIDFFRLLEIILADQRILQALYNAIFDQNYNK